MENNAQIEEYINLQKQFYEIFMNYIERENETQDYELNNLIKESENIENKKLLLRVILSISNNHHRNANFQTKIETIFRYLNNTLKQTMINSEFFDFFKINKLIILYLLKNQIIKLDKPIIENIKKETSYCHFFYPEIKQFLNKEENERIENEILQINANAFDQYEEKREKGENDNYICSLIRNDKAEEFISYVNRINISYSSKIKPSIFETNPFLVDKEPTMLEYAAFYGSIQIFQFLMMNGVELSESLWKYGIHSNSAEIIHILERNHVMPEGDAYENCFEESVKCHHNAIANYIRDNYLTNDKEYYYNTGIQYYNFSFFPDFSELSSYFYGLYVYGYTTITEYLISEKEKHYTSLIHYSKLDKTIQEAAEKDDTLAIYCLLSKTNQITENYFREKTHLTKIVIPPTITSIGEGSFFECTSLTQVSIPSSVTSIGRGSFIGFQVDAFRNIIFQLLNNPNQQEIGLYLLKSDHNKGYCELLYQISPKFLFNENEKVRILAFELLNDLVFSSYKMDELEEPISSLIVRYSEFIFQSKEKNLEFEKFVHSLSEILNLEFNLDCVIEKVVEIIKDNDYSIEYRVCCFPLIISRYKYEADIILIALQLTLQVCEKDRLSDNYLFCETFFERQASNNEESIEFFIENAQELSKSKKLSDNQVALLLIKTSIEVMDLGNLDDCINLTLKLGNCNDEKILIDCFKVFSKLTNNFKDSIVMKFDEISKFLLKNVKYSDSLDALSKLIKKIHRSPNFFTNTINSLLSILKTQEKSKSTEIFECINSCLSSGLTSISPFDKPFDPALKVYEIIMQEMMNSGESVIFNIIGNLVFYLPELIKKDLDKIMKVCQHNLKTDSCISSSAKCIRKITSYLPDSISSFLPEIVQLLLNSYMSENIIEILKCLCQIGTENDELGQKFDNLLLWVQQDPDYFNAILTTSAKFVIKRGFPVLSSSHLLSHFYESYFVCRDLKSIRQIMIFLPEEQNINIQKDIGQILILGSIGNLTNFLEDQDKLWIPSETYRQLSNCLITYADIYQQKLSSQVTEFYKDLEYVFSDHSKLNCIQLVHFLSKLSMFCRSEIDNSVLNDVYRHLFACFNTSTNFADIEKMNHILISFIYILRAKKELFDILFMKNSFINLLTNFKSNDSFEFELTRKTLLLNLVMIYELPVDDSVKNVLNEITFIKNMEVLPLLADCFIYFNKMVDVLPLLKKFASVLFSSESYLLNLIDKEALQFYCRLMESINQDELIIFTNLNESSLHQINYNLKKFSK